MKKILTIVLLLATALSINAQITTNIWGLTIGKSTKKQVISVLQKKGYRYSVVKNEANVQAFSITPKKGVYFGGINWKYVFLEFYNNTLYSIGFQTDKYSSAIDIYDSFELLKNRLNQKYSSYITDNDNYEINYNDGKTWVFLSIYDDSVSYGNQYLSLDYSDYKLFNIVYNEESDDL